jgi:hypothetical protein
MVQQKDSCTCAVSCDYVFMHVVVWCVCVCVCEHTLSVKVCKVCTSAVPDMCYAAHRLTSARLTQSVE